MSGTGQLENMTDSGIGTAFIVYPQSIVLLTNSGVANAIFAFVFYFCLCTLAIDSAFSIIEGVSTAVSDKFHLSHKKTTLALCIVASILSLWFVTSIKILAPIALTGFFIWNIVDLFSNGGIYGAKDGYSVASNVIGGWVILGLCVISGFIVKAIEKSLEKKGFVPDDDVWEDTEE